MITLLFIFSKICTYHKPNSSLHETHVSFIVLSIITKLTNMSKCEPIALLYTKLSLLILRNRLSVVLDVYTFIFASPARFITAELYINVKAGSIGNITVTMFAAFGWWLSTIGADWHGPLGPQLAPLTCPQTWIIRLRIERRHSGNVNVCMLTKETIICCTAVANAYD